MANQDEDFQVMLTKQDYDKLHKWEQLYLKMSKDYENATNEITQLKETNSLQKKTIYTKNQQINFVLGLLQSHVDKICGNSLPSYIDISKSYYQELADLQAEGMNSIFHKKLIQDFQITHDLTIKKVIEVQKIFASQQTQINHLIKLQQAEKISKIENIENEKKIDDPNNSKKQSEKNDKIQNLMNENKSLENRIKILEKDLQEKIQQTLRFEKQICAMKSKNVSSGEKSYQIKLLIDEYYKELQVNLSTVGGLDRKEIQMVVANQFKGIIEYVNTLMKKTFVTEVKDRK